MMTTLICILIGYPAAYFMASSEFGTPKVMAMLFILPMWINILLRTLSTVALFDFMKLPLGEGALIFGMVYNFLPYMVMPIHSVISKLDNRYIEAAGDLGCNGLRTLTRVILPLSASGIISGVTMVFVPCISTFYISQKLGGGTFDMIGDTIERQFQNPSTYNVGAALSLVMMILILISMAIMTHFSDDEGTVIV
jgi:spermidine/putrescine transport system permease protein